MKSVEKWDKAAADFQRNFRHGLNEYNRGVIRFLEENEMIFPGCKVADIGCGVGLYSAEFARLGCDVTLMDISPKMLEFAAQNMSGLQARWRTMQCDFLSDEISGAYDLSFASMSPAIQEVDAIKKMSGITEGWCFATRFASWEQKNKDELFRILDIHRHKDGDLGTDCEAFIRNVTEAGYEPKVKLVDYCWCDEYTIDGAIEYIMGKYMAERSYASATLWDVTATVNSRSTLKRICSLAEFADSRLWANTR